ncbi:hypothetical protein AMJ87_10310 [candidate division WOR_3 bacterium SM23_60]|uniref:DUF2723 domain-containing protein n=1 Tax=candidate division WOR_3 bacterium SM23_60 TaxID=1703780 RepID=A0A0S8GAL4_UNCW3|nr:MAG: hypothetical protein AMJ87_10310 [candidate division WOR_3 bacterium SM23_60]
MNKRKLERILLYSLVVITAGVYLYTVAPTLSFWDCGEFIASSYTLAVPHPPGTPLYVLLGKVWLLIVGVFAAVLPMSQEIAWQMNLLGIAFTILTIVFLYKMLLKIFRMLYHDAIDTSHLIVAFATCLSTAFFFTIWRNAIETEVYAAATFVFVLVNYLGLLWYDSVKQNEPKNIYVLFAFYLIFLATGIHLTPFLIFIPFYVFIFVVERRYIKDTLFVLLGIFQLIFFAFIFLLPSSSQLYVGGILALLLLLGIILPLNNPAKYKNWRFFWIGVFLVILGISSELYLWVRGAKLTELYQDEETTERYYAGENIAPRINECNPGESFTAFNNVLHRTQYGPAQILPRKTQTATGYGLVAGYYWQMRLFVRYLSWQPIPEAVHPILRAVMLALFYLFGIWGMIVLYRKNKKIFLFSVLMMVMLSFAMVAYLNLRFSPSDPNPEHQPQEVRERDYFFHTGHLYWGFFIGFGFLGLVESMKKEFKNKKAAQAGSLGVIVIFSIVPLVTNITVNNRYGDFIPKDYAYNMLSSCDEGSILFTNGDNDTFPLWFAQEVLRVRRDVIIANLSLINTNWYIKQLKYWGVPVSFSDYVIDRLEPFMTRDRRVFYVKDIMVRNILAANAGIQLKNEDYTISQQEFAERFLKGYKGQRPVYFASTVSHDNFEGFSPYLQLEGLVYRVTGDSGNPLYNIDIEKTQEFFYEQYRYTGIFEPAKQKIVRHILENFDKRKEEGEFYDFALPKEDNTKRLYSNYAAGLHNLGLVLKERGDIGGTIRAWRLALLFEPEPAYFFDYNIGLLFAELGIIDSAESYFSKIDVQRPGLMAQIGSIYLTIKHYDGAIEYFQRAMTMNAQFPQAYFGLFTAYLDKGDTNAAKRVLNDWLRINPRDTSAINILRELNTP